MNRRVAVLAVLLAVLSIINVVNVIFSVRLSRAYAEAAVDLEHARGAILLLGAQIRRCSTTLPPPEQTTAPVTH